MNLNDREDLMCSVCAGDPASLGRLCICGGEGTLDAELRGLRRYALELEAGVEKFLSMYDRYEEDRAELAALVGYGASQPR